MDESRPRLVLTFDLEDWHQIVHRSLGVADWDRPHPAFERQVEVLPALLDELRLRATFFVLGMCAKNYLAAVRERSRPGGTSSARTASSTCPSTGKRARTSAGTSRPALSSSRVSPAGGYRLGVFRSHEPPPGPSSFCPTSASRTTRASTTAAQGSTTGIPDEPYRLEVRPGKELLESRSPSAAGGGSGSRSAEAPTGESCRDASSSLLFFTERLRPRPRQYSISTPMSSIRSHSRTAGGPRARAAANVLYWNARRGRIARLRAQRPLNSSS